MGHRRRDRRTGRLTDDRFTTLSSLPGWTWDPAEDDWQEGLAQLQAYVDHNGHARVPYDHVTDSGYKLGSWVSHQRRRKLKDQQTAALNLMSGWTWDPHEYRWQEGLAELRAFVEREGHARVPAAHVTGDGHRLGAWVRSRRINHRAGKLAEDRVDVLETLPGWTWGSTRGPYKRRSPAS